MLARLGIFLGVAADAIRNSNGVRAERRKSTPLSEVDMAAAVRDRVKGAVYGILIGESGRMYATSGRLCG